MVEGLLEALEAAIDDLAIVDVDASGDAEVHDLVVGLGRLSTRLEAAWCRLIARWDARQVWADDGSKASGARLARETHGRRGHCDRLVRRARDLTVRPHSTKAYAAGEITGRHVDLVASCNREWRNAEFADSEEFLVNRCRTPLFGVAYRTIEYWKQLADRDAADRDAESVKAGRHLSASVGWRGELVINGALDPLGGEIVKTELDRLCEQLRLQDLRDRVERTPRQRRADALVEMATRSATAPADGLRPRPLFTVLIGIEPFTHLCETAAGTIIAPGLLLPYLSNAEIERVVYDPPNRRFEASHRRNFTGAVRRVVEIRDQHCQHPSGCEQPANRCDVDHVVPRGEGITCICNGQLLCAYHNRTSNGQREPPTAPRTPARTTTTNGWRRRVRTPTTTPVGPHLQQVTWLDAAAVNVHNRTRPGSAPGNGFGCRRARSETAQDAASAWRH
jgi:hypothetical protein